MHLSIWILFISFCLQTVRGAILLWSDQEIRISPLQEFTLKDLSKLAENLEKPDIHIFQGASELTPAFKQVINGYYSAYTPNGNIESENMTYLLGDDDLDILKIKEVVSDYKSNNILFAINIPDIRRQKRELEVSSSQPAPSLPPSTGSVIYRARNTNTKQYALLYSSSALVLRKNDSDTEEIYLGNTDPDMIIYDTRLNIQVIPLNHTGKITLRFSFIWVSGYWYLKHVKVEETAINKDYNLTTEDEVMASEQFSYHCNGVTVFTDGNGAELRIYDLQVQPDSKDGKFDDANDCVPFMTAPILSGLFITGILTFWLLVSISSMMNIKTMDRFDNLKTKNLAITLSD